MDEPLEMWQIQRIALVSRLRMLRGDQTRTAISLNVSRGWVIRKIREWEITHGEVFPAASPFGGRAPGYKRPPRTWNTRPKKSD